MKNRLPTLAAAALLAMSIVPFPNNASAMPLADGIAIKNAAPTNVETVRWRGRGWGRGIGAGIVGGAILGGMLAAPYYGYGPGPYYGYGPGPYYGPGPGPYAYEPGYGGDAVAYCMQRFRSYDPNSGTYVGFDGLRHSCP